MVGPAQRSPVGYDADRIDWDIVEEHLAEVEFLFEQWHLQLDAPHYTLPELRRGPEERLLAHLDGLHVGGPVVIQRLEPELADEATDPLRAAAVALALLSSPDRALGRALVQRFPSFAAPVRTGVSSALAACDRPDLSPPLATVIGQGGDAVAELLGVAALRGDDLGGALDPLLSSDDPALRVALARAARSPDRRRLPWAERASTVDDAPLRDAAIELGLVLGSEHAWQLTGRLALDPRHVHRDAMTWLAQLGEPRSIDGLIARLDDASARPDVLWALGFSGRVAAANACLPWLADEAVANVAGEAFAGITGIDTRRDEYWDDAPPAPDDTDEGLPPLVDDLATDLGVSPARELRPPRPEAIAQWWTQHRARFNPDQRYIMGIPANAGGLLQSLHGESMRRRHARAFELAVRTRGQIRVPTRVLSSAQLRVLASSAGATALDGNRPFSRIG